MALAGGISSMIDQDAWHRYNAEGYLDLGCLLNATEEANLRQRADDIAAGRLENSSIRLQLDTGGSYDNLAPIVQRFDAGTTRYRKIQGLETDEHFGALLRKPLFAEVCAHEYGPHTPISVFRAMIMNKPAELGTILPWHQDGGDVWALDRDPLVTIWVALDRADETNGCVEVVVGSHRLGLLSRYGSTISDDDAAHHCRPELVRPLVVEPGHAVLMHNWLIHRSGVNPSTAPRRAFTACLMDGRTRGLLTGQLYPLVFDGNGVVPFPWLDQLAHDVEAHRSSFERAEEYAKSLLHTNDLLRASAETTATYARSLELEVAKLRAYIESDGHR